MLGPSNTRCNLKFVDLDKQSSKLGNNMAVVVIIRNAGIKSTTNDRIRL